LHCSDHRFNLLFRAVDSIGGDGTVGEEDLVEFMFPSIAAAEDASAPAAAVDEERGHGSFLSLFCMFAHVLQVADQDCVCLVLSIVALHREPAPESRPAVSPARTPSAADKPAAPRAYTAAEREALYRRAAEIRADIAASRQLNPDTAFVASVAAGDFRSTGGKGVR
jgi:hypothetical protein